MSAEVSIQAPFIDMSSAKEMWEYLQQRYQQTSEALSFSLEQRLTDLQQQDMSIEYYSAFTSISSQLASDSKALCWVWRVF